MSRTGSNPKNSAYSQMSHDEPRRLFIAVELPPNVVKTIEQVQNDLKGAILGRGAKWVSPDSTHLTLKFLGDVPAQHIDKIIAGMQEAANGFSTFFLTIEGLGCFPNTKNPRVLWLGLTGNVRGLSALQASIESQIAPMGYPTEDRAFHPHLTLARTVRGARRDEIEAIGKAAEHGLGTLGSWRVEGVSLIRSDLRPTGAVYTREALVLLDR